MKTQVLQTKFSESALAGVGRNNICEYLLFEMALGRHENTKFCTTKLENLHWQGWAGIIYVNIFYLKWLWEGMKTFCTRNRRICTGRGGHVIYIEYLLQWHMKTFAHEIFRICTGRGGQE